MPGPQIFEFHLHRLPAALALIVCLSLLLACCPDSPASPPPEPDAALVTGESEEAAAPILNSPTPAVIRQACLHTMDSSIRLESVVLGCSVTDCCAGCPSVDAPWAAEAVVRVAVEQQGKVVQAVALAVDNLAELESGGLEVSGGDADDDGRVWLGQDEATFRFPSGSAGAVVVTPELTISGAALQPPLEGRMEIRFSSLVGDEVVSEFVHILDFLECRPLSFPCQECRDRIVFTDHPGQGSQLVLADGRTVFGCSNDAPFYGGAEVGTGNFLATHGCRDELFYFHNGHIPVLLDTENYEQWDQRSHAPGDVLKIPWAWLEPASQVSLHFIAAGADNDTLVQQAVDQLVAAGDLLESKGYSSLKFDVEPADLEQGMQRLEDGAKVTEIRDLAEKIWWMSNREICDELPGLLDPIRQDPGVDGAPRSGYLESSALNIFYLDQVEEISGQHVPNCDGSSTGIIFIGPYGDLHTLIHEIGHALSLDHVGGWSPRPQCPDPLHPNVPCFCEPDGGDCWIRQLEDYNNDGFGDLLLLNFMHEHQSSMPDRAGLTEGQLFRVFFNDSSIINTLQLRSPGPLRQCEDRYINALCPWLALDPENP